MGKKTRKDLENFEIKYLASYAIKSVYSKGRKIKIEEHPFRTCFQRDIDRIIHSKAFRRLEYKTQVYVNHEGDHYRTRLTHTLEVVQLSSAVSRVLGLNEDLTRAIAFGHDLGHTPFGHSGETILNEIMKKEKLDGFKHNEQGVKVIDKLEKKYNDYDGLNLTWEVREGILKHTSIRKNKYEELEPEKPATLEGQVVAICDEIAQDSHDLDDGLREKIITIEDIELLDLYKNLNKEINDLEIIKNLINFLITDIIDNSSFNLKKEKFIIDFSKQTKSKEKELRNFLTEKIYHSCRIKRMDNKAKDYIEKLYYTYKKDPLQLPDEILERYNSNLRTLKDLTKVKKDPLLSIIICDYIAGMTDRYAQDEYKKLFMPFELV